MLVLSRRSRESVVVGGGGGFDRLLKITVLDVDAGKVKLGFEVDSDVPVYRLEIWERMRTDGALDSRKAGREPPDGRSG